MGNSRLWDTCTDVFTILELQNIARSMLHLFLLKSMCTQAISLDCCWILLNYRIRYATSNQRKELCFSAQNLKLVSLLNSRQLQNGVKSDVPVSGSWIWKLWEDYIETFVWSVQNIQDLPVLAHLSPHWIWIYVSATTQTLNFNPNSLTSTRRWDKTTDLIWLHAFLWHGISQSFM